MTNKAPKRRIIVKVMFLRSAASDMVTLLRDRFKGYGGRVEEWKDEKLEGLIQRVFNAPERFIMGNPISSMVEIVEKVNCPSCGAPLKIKAGEIIITCEYCGTAVNLKAEKPFVFKHAIIPNKHPQEEIEKLVRAWMQSGFIMPENLARKAQFKQINLKFLPFYVVTAHAVTEYEGVFIRTGNPREIKDTIANDYQWTVLGRRSAEFPEREYKVPLSGKASFDLSLVQGEFLNAELDESEAEEKVRKEIESLHNYLMKEKVDQIIHSETQVEIKDCEFLHAPIWFIEYEYKGKLYRLVMDGSTGEVIKGDIPLDEKKFPW